MNPYHFLCLDSIHERLFRVILFKNEDGFYTRNRAFELTNKTLKWVGLWNKSFL